MLRQWHECCMAKPVFLGMPACLQPEFTVAQAGKTGRACPWYSLRPAQPLQQQRPAAPMAARPCARCATRPGPRSPRHGPAGSRPKAALFEARSDDASAPSFEPAVLDSTYTTRFQLPQRVDLPSGGARLTLTLEQHLLEAQLLTRGARAGSRLPGGAVAPARRHLAQRQRGAVPRRRPGRPGPARQRAARAPGPVFWAR